MAKKNPKHDVTRRSKSTNVVQYRKRGIKRKYIYIMIVAALVIIPIAISASLLSKQNAGTATVQVGDNVTVHYKLWYSNGNGDKLDLLQDGTFNITIKSTANETGLIVGFYNGLLGMSNGQIKSYLYVPPGDGYTSYQSVTSQTTGKQYNLDNAPLVFWLQVENITATSS